jgi:serine/threonine-protein kinase
MAVDAQELSQGSQPKEWRTCVELAVEAFRSAWARGQRPNIEEALWRLPDEARLVGLVELVHTELELRIKAREEVRVEDYLQRFPELARDPKAVSALVEAEFRFRRRREPGVPIDVQESLGTQVLPTESEQTQEYHAAAIETPVVAGYELLGELARGGMGVVYKARHQRLNRLVALKMILAGERAAPSQIARFLAEAEAVAHVRHPNIVQIYDVGQHGQQPFFSLELVEGGSLGERLRAGAMPPRQAAELIETLARATHAAHLAGIVHRDLKPSNVLLTGDGIPKIADFGLAKRLNMELRQTRTGAVLGTPSYMAPEQAQGKASDIGPATDVYALGAMLYETLTGRPPFRARTYEDVLLRVIHMDPVSLRRRKPTTPRDLETICLKCLEKDPRRRYPSARALADDLRRWLDGDPIVARHYGVASRVAGWARRQPALAVTFAAVAAIYCNHLVFLGLGVPNQGGSYHWFVTGLGLCWAAGAIWFSRVTSRARWRSAGVYAWAAMDVVLVTALLLVAEGPKSSLTVLYFILVTGSALRARLALVWYVTGLCLGSYALLLVDTTWRRPMYAIPAKDSAILLLSMALVGLSTYLLLRRSRTTAPTDW